MLRSRLALPALALLLALIAAGCGSAKESRSSTTTETFATKTTEAAPGKIGVGSAKDGHVTSTAFVETAAMRTCLAKLGFTHTDVPQGGAAAWSNGKGNAMIVALPDVGEGSEQVAQLAADELPGTPRRVAGTNLLVTGRSPQLDAAVACLR
jgi:hypothetical protein